MVIEFTTSLRRASALGLALVVAACGGGGGDTAGSVAVDPRAATVTLPGGGTVTMLASAGEIALAEALTTAPSGAASIADMTYPVGFLKIDVVGLLDGETITLKLQLPAGSAPNAYVKCTSDTSCADFTEHVTFNPANPDEVTLTLTDGGFGDTDGVNGEIHDPGAPAVDSTPPDADQDGIADATDNCRDQANADQMDVDDDRIGDVCDDLIDNDGDLVPNDEDNCIEVENEDQADVDDDNVGDACDPLIDTDRDGIDDAVDNCAQQTNADQANQDGDALGDVCDGDVDGDGAPNDDDNCRTIPNADQADEDNDGYGDACVSDLDGDGVLDHQDNCPDVANPQQENADGDSTGDVCDALTDRDGDGKADDADNCPDLPNADQTDRDGDEIGDACDDLIDTDGDTVADDADNCLTVANLQQQNADGDALGDACDPDLDGDGRANGADNCPAIANADQSDYDGQGVGDACDTSSPVQFFKTRVQPNLAACRMCHVDQGVADTPEGDGLQLTTDPAQDLARFYQAWDTLGRGSTSNKLLTKASNSEPHAGGAVWPTSGQAYQDAAQLLACWDNPANCALVGAQVDADHDGLFDNVDNCPLVANPDQADVDDDDIGDRCELLGSSRGGHVWFDYCEANNWQANLTLPQDPRSLVAKDNAAAHGNSVYFNSYWKDCHVDVAENNGQGDGMPDRLDRYVSYTSPNNNIPSTEKAHPKTCGELKHNYDRGAVMMGAAPYDPSLLNADEQPVRRGSTFAADHGGDGRAAGVIPASAYRELWRTWGPAITAPAPDVFDRMVAERYGLGSLDAGNPYPRAGENPVTTNGGTGRLPTGLIQMLDSDGDYTGGIGINCQGCHGSEVAGAFRPGAGGAMLDLGTFGRDLEAVNAFLVQSQGGLVGVGAGLDRVGVAGRTRGTNNAQFSNVTAVVGAFSTDSYANGFNSMFFPITGDVVFCKNSTFPPFFGGGGADPRGNFCDANVTNPDVATKLVGGARNGSTATGDTPAWWNVGHRTVKFVDGLFPADAVRVDMALFFPLFDLTTPQGFGFPPTSASQTNPFTIAEKFVGEYAQWVDNWLMSLKAPEYPLAVDTELAEAGARLFHNLDLWNVPGKANPVAKSALGASYSGNGSCASCHGAYAPAYVNNTAYLKDSRLEGIASFVVPKAAILTDPVRLDTYDPDTNEAFSNQWIAYDETGYKGEKPTLDGDRFRPTYEEKYDCTVQRPATGRDNDGRKDAQYGRDGVDGGYAAPPLYGVWATAPYFHNGSVPDVWGVLKSTDRPRIWERKSKARPADFPTDAVMGYDSSLAAFDAARLGWRHEVLGCLNGVTGGQPGHGSAPVLECYPNSVDNEAVDDTAVDRVPTVQSILGVLYSGVLATWNVTNPPILTSSDVENRKIYNTAMHSQGNGGHEFTDVLTDEQRRAIIEYLKTL